MRWRPPPTTPPTRLTVTRNGTVVQTFPMSMGMAAGGHQTPNGTYYVLDKKMPTVVMDSSTYGVPVHSTYGYKVDGPELAVQFDNSGDYVHSAPWSVADQGKRDVSHGCINISPSNAQWFFDNFGAGDPVIVKNSVGDLLQERRLERLAELARGAWRRADGRPCHP